MKRSINFLSILLSMLALSMFVACSSDDDATPDNGDGDGNGGGDVVVANGVYVVGSATSTDAIVDYRFSAARIDQFPDAVSRSGLVEGYVFLKEGDFKIVKYANNQPTEYGGTIERRPMAEGSTYDMGVGTLAVDGAAVSSFETGLHHITFDETSRTLVAVPVKEMQVIGSATPGGWGTGTSLALGAASENEVVFSSANIAMRSGEYKVRYNNNWSIDLSESVDGLILFTNFGGAITALEAGGPNIAFAAADAGNYTVSMTYTPGEGNSVAATLELTGDVEPITFDPTEYNFGVIGSATAGGWDADRDLRYLGNDATKGHTWGGIVYLAAGEGQEFKFRTNDAWDFDLGGTLGTDGSLNQGGANIAAPDESGVYYVEVFTNDDGAAWTGTIAASSWGIIGEGGPSASWDVDAPMTSEGFADGITTHTLTGTFSGGEFKFRANSAWSINYGGSLEALTFDGANLSLEAGEYEVVLSFDGTNYTATATLQ